MDQNTDRMWYVIGAIVIGSALLLAFMHIVQLVTGTLLTDVNQVANYDSFMLYYHGYNDRTIANLKRYDMVVLEPLSMDVDTLHDIQGSGTDVYAYQSVIGVELANAKKLSLMNDEDYMWVNGEKPKHKYFKYHYGDIRSEAYQDVLLQMLKEDVIDAGYDGIFYDTLDDMDQSVFRDNRNPETNVRLRNEMMLATIEYFKKVRKMYPNLSIIQNRGFDLYTMTGGSAPYVDSMMFENLDYRYFESEAHGPFYQNLRERIDKAAKENQGVVMTLAYQEPEENFEKAKEFNWFYSYYDSSNYMLEEQQKIYNSFNPNELSNWLEAFVGMDRWEMIPDKKE